MNKNTGMVAIMIIIIFMAGIGSAQSLNLTSSSSFKDHNFAITKFVVNGTVGTPKALDFATVEEPLIIIDKNQTIAVYLEQWGIDSSRLGVQLSISNGTGPGTVEYLMPLQRGWGSQIDEVTFGDLKIRVGLTEIFRGKTAEWAKFCITAIKMPKK